MIVAVAPAPLTVIVPGETESVEFAHVAAAALTVMPTVCAIVVPLISAPIVFAPAAVLV